MAHAPMRVVAFAGTPIPHVVSRYIFLNIPSEIELFVDLA